jgi:predicted double-glycine peptidase
MKIIILFLPTLLFSQLHIIHDEFRVSKNVKSWIEIKNQNLTRQKFDYSCGSASLSTILKYYYKNDISEKDVLNKVLQQKGVSEKKEDLEDKDFTLSFLDLVLYLQSINFRGVGVALNFEDLQKLQVPVILFVKIRKNEHFTIYKNSDENYIYLADPSFGNIKVKKAKFLEMFYTRNDEKHQGKFLAVIPNSEIETNQEFRKIIEKSDFLIDILKFQTFK